MSFFTTILSRVYGFFVGLRNLLYDEHLLHSAKLPIPTICIGNLSVGGTGKTPHTEFFAGELQQLYKVAVLSRGYRRKTRGFLLVDDNANAFTVGDEALQLHHNLPEVIVAVCENRVRGCRRLMRLFPDLEVILLDDGFQHRRLHCGFYVLLTAADNLFIHDHLLPHGRLREHKMGSLRANMVIVTKCPEKMQPIDKRVIDSVKNGTFANFAVNELNRANICANHSVTHLAHKALKIVLGDHVAQKGSFVEAGRMRFDISHPKQITLEEIRRVEEIVNSEIRHNLKVSTVIMNKDEAVKLGAMALFDEKYSEDVRVVTMGDTACPFSRELCGGTHVKATGDIGYFHILSEYAIAAGVRRLECITGLSADNYVANIEDKLHLTANLLKTNVNDLENRINGLLEERKNLQNEIFNLKKSLASSQSTANDETETINGVKFVGKLIPDSHPKELKSFADDILQKINSGIVILCSNKDNKASIVAAISPDLTKKYNAVDLVRCAASILGGSGGGGRPDMAQAGGNDVAKIDEAISKIKEMIA